jgi:toxin ParE1/3/4
MPRLRYSERSRDDLVAIWHFIATDSPRNAEAVLQRLHDKCERLRHQPLIGHRRDDLRRGLRCLNSDGYMIFYRPTIRLVRIDRIIHHSRHLSAVFLDSPP